MQKKCQKENLIVVNIVAKAVDKHPKISQYLTMKEKTITIKTKGISQRQYSTLLLELNIMKRQWRSYGVDLQISAPSLKKIITLGTSNGSDITKRRII